MPGSHVEHVFDPLDNTEPLLPQRQSLLQSPNQSLYGDDHDDDHDDTFDTALDDPLTAPSSPPPPPLAFLPPAACHHHPSQPDPVRPLRPSVPASVPNVNNNNPEENGRDSPDPHEYYLKHQPLLAEGHKVGEDPGGVLAVGNSNNNIVNVTAGAHWRKASVPSFPADTLGSARESLRQYRSTSDSTYRSFAPGPGRVRPVVPTRSRKTSFQDLVNRFNNKFDEVLPVPSRSRSRAPSRADSRAPSADGQARSRTSSRLRDTREFSGSKRPAFVRWDSAGSPLSDPSDGQHLDVSETSALDSQSPLDLNPSDSTPRQPLWDELLSLDSRFYNQGYGVPSHLRRRGSEGSIASPNPTFVEHYFDQSSAGLPPVTPTAWYLGHASSLEAIDAGPDSSCHRRTRSDDFTGNSSAWSRLMAVPHPANSGAAPETPQSKSRIPVSSSRLSHGAAGSGNASPSTMDNPTFRSRSSQVSLPPKGTSRLPIPSPKSSIRVDDAPASFPIKPSPGRREVAHGRGRHQLTDRSPLLKAYIAAPPPKKSPPLRSSRPRQPVSHAASSASRSNVIEKVSNLQKQIESRGSRPRDRRVPELGKVDFAMRRQKIQQAFNRTVQENARREEQIAELRRRARKEERKASGTQAHVEGQQPPENNNTPVEVTQQAEDTAAVIDQSTEIHDGKKQLAPEEGSSDSNNDSEVAPRFKIDADLPVGDQNTETAAENHLTTEDSPTLGVPDTADRKEQEEQEEEAVNHADLQSSNVPSNIAPPSSVTSGSTDTHVTFFDPEPQTEFPDQSYQSHRTLLNQIMQMRESSPSSSSSCDEHDYNTFSDSDDKESIPILLRETSYLEDSVEDSDSRGHRDLYGQQSQPEDEMRHRWSMSSWSSSIRHQPSTDAQCDEEDSHDLLHRVPSAAESEQTSSSCSASSTAPPSITEQQFAASLPQNDLLTEQKSREALQQNSHPLSNAPSLARQGGWDSKRVTQLYLEELARGRGHSLPMPAVRASPEPRFLDVDRRVDGRANSLTDDPVLVSKFEGIPASDRVGHSASLVFRDDWEHASPSIADWMQVAAEDESAPPSAENHVTTVPRREGAPTPRLAISPAELAGSEVSGAGLGLSINVRPPQELDSQEVCPPPLPMHSPPPPPPPAPPRISRSSTAQGENGFVQPPLLNTPSFHSDEAPLLNGAFGVPERIHSTGSSENSSLRRLGPAMSSQADSSATSLLPSTSEQAGFEVKKGSPSPEQRRLKKRRHVIKELVDTEYTFGRDMKVVDDIYKGTSSSCLDLSVEDVKTLFANSDQIVQFSMSFQDALKAASKSVYVMPKSQRWSSKRSARRDLSSTPKDDRFADSGTSDFEKDQMTFVGQVFMAHLAQMEKVYADYLKNHDAANKKLQVLQRNPKVAIWLKECREWASDLTSAWDLDSLLVKPVQRILKYPLLLKQLLDSTPDDHPDHAAIVSALEGVTNISVRINEMKKRAELVEQVVSRKRKESDVRAGLSKAFGRRTEKLRQQVGLSDMLEDKDYDALSQRFGDSFFQLQVVMRDVETYTREIQDAMGRFSEFVAAIEGYIDVAQSHYAEMESKWRRFKLAIRDIMSVALPDHVSKSLFCCNNQEHD